MSGPGRRDDQSARAIRVAADPRFHEMMRPVADWIERSLVHRRDPENLLELQAEMGVSILALQKRRREFEAQVHDDDSPELSRAILEVKRAIRVIRDVGNGMAWRALNYDRLLIRQLALKPPSGGLEQESFEAELETAFRWVRDSGRTVVLNDLTDCLRFGDLTGVSEASIEVAEVKMGRGSARSGQARRQKRRAATQLALLNVGLSRAPDGRVAELMYARALAQSHMGEVRQLLEARRAVGFARLTDSLAVNVVRPQLAADEAERPRLQNPFRQAKQAFSTSSIELFEIWPSNMAPLSIFPLAVSDRVDLLTGAAVIFSSFNLGNVVRHFRRRGLIVKLPDEHEVAPLADVKPGDQWRHELDAPIRVSKVESRVELLMSFTPLGRIVNEFVDEASIADLVEETLDSPRTGEGLMAAAFANESQLWD